MRAVVQRVKNASVAVDNEIISEINNGLLVFVGVKPDDTKVDRDYIINKVTNLRIFEDEDGKMNLSVKDVGGEILVVSQFTLYGDCRKGRRPSFVRAGDPKEAELVYNDFIEEIQKEPINVKTGVFQAEMDINLINDGPVTMLLDSEKEF